MKKLWFAAAAVLLISSSCMAQGRQRASPRETVEAEGVSVTYSRPYKKGREIFGGLEKWGAVWRTGADEGTEITFSKDGTFGGQPVKAGRYTLFTIPNPDEWTIILNSELNQWGAYGYDKVKDKNVLTAKVKPQKLNDVVEQLTIKPGGGKLSISWDQTLVEVPYKF